MLTGLGTVSSRTFSCTFISEAVTPLEGSVAKKKDSNQAFEMISNINHFSNCIIFVIFLDLR